MVIRVTIFFSFIFSAITSFAQKDTSFRLLKTFLTDVSNLAVDNLDNIYLLSSTNQLKKISPAGDSIASYNNTKRFGTLHSIDVSNPLKIILFHKDFSTIVILDRLLSERASIDLRKHNIVQVSSVGLSYDNNIWIFDEYDNKLKKLDENGNILLETSDFRTAYNQSFLPQQIIDHNNLVYLYDPSNGILVLDHYGTFKRKIPITQWKSISINDKYISGIFNNAISYYNTSTLQQYQHNFPQSFHGFNNYIIANSKLFAMNKDSVNIYSFNF